MVTRVTKSKPVSARTKTTKKVVPPPVVLPTPTTVQTTTNVRRGSWVAFIAVILAVAAITLAVLALYYPKSSSSVTANSSLPVTSSPAATSNPAPAPIPPKASELQRSGIVVDASFVKAMTDAGYFLYLGSGRDALIGDPEKWGWQRPVAKATDSPPPVAPPIPTSVNFSVSVTNTEAGRPYRYYFCDPPRHPGCRTNWQERFGEGK